MNLVLMLIAMFFRIGAGMAVYTAIIKVDKISFSLLTFQLISAAFLWQMAETATYVMHRDARKP